jgi:WD40 repeat protein
MKKIYCLLLILSTHFAFSQSMALQLVMDHNKYNYNYDESPSQIVFHPKRDLIGLSSNSRMVKIISYKEDSIWQFNPIGMGGVSRILFSPDGNEFIFTRYLSNSDVAILDMNTMQLKQNIKVAKEIVNDLIMSTDGKAFVTSGSEGTIKIFNQMDGEWGLFHEIIVPQQIDTDKIEEKENTSKSKTSSSELNNKLSDERDLDLYFTIGNALFASELIDKTYSKEKTVIKIFALDAKKNKAIYELLVDGNIKAMQVHPNGKNIIISTNKEAIIYEWKNNQLVRGRSFVDFADAEILKFDISGRYLMCAIHTNIKICRWSNENLSLNNEVEFDQSISDMNFSEDNKYFGCNVYKRRTKVWKTGLNTDNKKPSVQQQKNTTNVEGTGSNSNSKPASPIKNAIASKNYLFTIGINSYKDYPVLSNAKKDAEDVKKALITKYKINTENTKELLDNDASSKNILDALNNYVDNLTENDQLIIYYSGHGHYNKQLDEGYWIPVDAMRGKELDFLPNSTLVKYLKAIPAKHIFLVVDACFSGSLMSSGTRGFLENVTQFKSRWALTSGRYEVVSDGLEGKNSPFAEYFIKYLNENTKPKFAVSEIVGYVKQAVSNNAEQTPWGNAIRNAGDEGGEFIFELK